MVEQAADVWPDLPVGGSIDDAHGTAGERVAPVAAAVLAVLDRQPDVGRAQA